MKKFLSIVLSILMIVTMIPVSALSVSAATENITVTIDTGASVTLKDTDGDDYYEIGTADELYAFSAAVNSGKNTINGELTANITVNNNVLKADGSLNGDGSNFRKWIPIGEYLYDYYGNFEGNSKIVSGLYFNDSTTEYNTGMFGLVRDNEIRNLGVVDSYFCGNNNVGGITGRNFDSFIKRCYSINTIIGNSYVGGITGHATFTLDHCFYIGQISGNKDVGAIVGYLSPNLSTCYYLNTNPVAGRGVPKTAEEFASGEIAVLLGGDFGQDIDNGKPKQAYPSFDGASVYAIKNCIDETLGYTNHAEKAIVDHELNDANYCVICGIYNPPKGNGTSSNPYLIDNLDDLYWFADQVNSGKTKIHAKLTADITINTGVLKADGTRNDNYADFTNWKSIGCVSKRLDNVYQYEGTFNGNGKTISGIHCDNNMDQDYAGLFACIGSNGKVINLTIKDSYFYSKWNSGSIAGANYGTIENCHNYSYVSCTTNLSGGIVGINYKTIRNCTNYGVVYGNVIAGIAGENQGTITKCYNEGTISADIVCGGIVGKNSGTVSYCYNVGTIEGEDDVGGIAGRNYNKGKITYCYNAGTVQTSANDKANAESDRLHAIVNINEGTVSDCYYDNIVTVDVGMNNSGTCKNILSFSTEEFATGKVAYLLGAPFGQDIDNGKTKQTYPTFSGAEVYFGYNTCDENADKIYSNNVSKNSETRPAHTCKINSNKCTVCGKENAHTYEQTRIDATCSAQGIVIYRCSVCGDEYNEILNSTGHKFTYTYDSSTHKGVCEYCGYIDQYVHEYEREYFDPTCETDGYYTDTCKCGYSYSKVTSTKYYHTGGEATCYSLAICDMCGNTYGDYLDHTGGTPTCTEPAKCEVCGEGYGQAKGHIADMDDGDCTTDIPCSVCGISYIKGNAVHTWNENNFCANENCRQTKGFTFTFTYGEEVLFVRNVHTGNFYHFESAEERDGMTLLGWDEDGDGVIDYEVNEYIYIDEDRTFEAVYGLIYTIHYITYDIWNNCYDEVFFPQTGEPGDTITLYDDFSYYYKFLGWALEEDGEVVYDPGQEITLTENLTLYGIIRPYQATFDIGEGAVWNDEDGNPITIIQGDYEASWIEIYDFPTKTGYIFTGFADQYDGTWSPWENEDTGVTMLDFYFDGSDLEMTAQWEKCRNHNYIDDVCEYCGLHSADECKHPTGTQTCMGYKCDNCGDFYGEAGDHYGTKLTCQGYICDTCGETYGDTVGNHDFENGICTVCDAVSPDVIVIEMRDDYGDGWNRAKLGVFIVDSNGNETEYKVYTLETGDYAKELIISDSDTVYRFYWIAGDYDYECSLTIKKGDETLYEVDDCSYIRDGLFMTVTVDVCEHDYVAVETKSATCTENGEMTYTCACGDSYTEVIPADENAHDWSDCDGICVNGCGYECAHESNTDNVCDTCGKSLHICDFSGEWKYDIEGHWKECTCGETTQTISHNFDDGEWFFNEAFHWKKCECGCIGLDETHEYEGINCIYCGVECTHRYYIDGGCGYCDYECPHENVTDEICEKCGKNLHVCDFGGEWSSNETNHWKECACGKNDKNAKHTFTDGVCSVCEYECLHKNVVNEICKDCGKNMHVHDYGDVWEADRLTHWKICSCDESSIYGDHEYTDGICDICEYACLHLSVMNGSCLDCGMVLHSCDFSGEWKYNNEKHWKECTCGIKDGEAEHSFTDGKCACGYECSHKWGEGVLTRPTRTEEGCYTYTCSICKDTKIELVERPSNYAEFKELLEKVKGYLDENLTESMMQEVNNVINFFNLDANHCFIKGEENTVSQMIRQISEFVEVVEEGIADGTALKADYTEIDATIASLAEKLADVNLTDKAKAELEAIKAQLAAMKNNDLSSKADVAELMESVTAFADTVAPCINGTHTFEYEVTSPAECGKNAVETGTCEYCNATTEREVENSALTHADEDGDYICDNGCGYEFEKPEEPAPEEPSEPSEPEEPAPEEPSEPETPEAPEDTESEVCEDCGKVHDGFFAKLICFFTRLINFIKNLFV